MHVRPRREIVHLGLENDINPIEITGDYLTPKEFMTRMQEDNTVVIDARNDYEFDLGHFRGAVRLISRTSEIYPLGWRNTRKILLVRKY